MEKIFPEIRGMIIVLIGDFNPSIFSPVWYANEGLIRKKEAEKAEIQIVHQDVTTFNLEWLRFQVTRNQYVLETWEEPYEEVIRDITLGTFGLLRHTPIKKLGINYQAHYKIDSVDQWHAIGHKLAPKEVWNKIFSNPGMKSLSIENHPREDGLNGFTRIEVQPSNRVNPGIYFNVNDHFEVKDIANSTGSDEIMEILANNWASSCKRSRESLNMLLGELL